jgi:hypothetical protein
MTYPRNAQPVGAGSGGADAEKAAFLRDLRALRDRAGLGSRDLAARAHFPEDTLKTAEAGPALPSLPVLQAYVRGCGAAETEWEDRWRRLNSDSDSGGGSALPTRAPSTARPPGRMMPFPQPENGRNPAEQDAIGFGLARVARGLAPIEPDQGPTISPGMGSGIPGGFRPFAGEAGGGGTGDAGGSGDGGGWFDPAPKPSSEPSGPFASPSPSGPSGPFASPAPPVPPAPAVPEVSPGAPTMQYPALSGYQEPETSYQEPSTSYPGAYSTPSYDSPAYEAPAYERPSYEPPEMFRTPAPEPPSPPSPIAPGPTGMAPGPTGTTPAPSGLPTRPAGPTSGSAATPVTSGAAALSASPGPLAASAPGATAGSAGSATAHAAPAPRQRRIGTGVIAAVVAVIIIAAVLWLVFLH